MKTFKLIALGMMLMFAGTMQSQLSVRLNIGTPPAWGPSGYNGVRYYYLPDIESYYDVQSSMFIYPSGNRWIHSRNLPARYRNYDLYHGYKVVMNDYRGNTPYIHHREYRTRYARGYRGGEQHNIGERHDNRPRGRVIERHERMDNHGIGRDKGRDNRPDNRGNKGNDRNNREGHGK